MALMKSFCFRIFALIFFLIWGASAGAEEDTGALDGLDFGTPAGTYWALPKELKDVAGMALSGDGRLFVHERERAIIHEINYVEGTIVKTFSFGRPAAKKDFQGLAIAGKRFFLINGKGLLLEGREGFNYEGKVFNTYDAGISEFCEAGGLAATETKLLILCHKPKKDDYKGFLTIFSWDIAAKSADEDPFLKIPLSEHPELEGLEPSSLDVLADGNLLVLSEGRKMILEVSPEGRVIKIWDINKKWHNNPEGMTVTKDGELIIADGGNSATLQVYSASKTRAEN